MTTEKFRFRCFVCKKNEADNALFGLCIECNIKRLEFLEMETQRLIDNI